MSSHAWPGLFVLLLVFLGIWTSGLTTAADGGVDEASSEDGTRAHVRVRRQTAEGVENVVELLMVADRQAFAKYLARNNNNSTAAVADLLRYVAGLVREANERFATLSRLGISVRVNLVGLVVFSTAAESSATENSIRSGDVINADAALISFLPQALALSTNVSFDYAVLLTGYNVTRGNGGDADVRTFFGGMCGVTRAGIVENFCVERTALALTKGIALNMGVFTDGVSNNCADEFFTLSFDFNVPPRQFRGNPFTFSNCSAEEIRSFLMNTTSACLRTQSVANPVNVSGIAAEELGQSFVADRQCEDRFGNVSRFCRSLYGISANFTFVDDLCRDMRCSIPGTSSCVGTLPFDGTSCGIQRWCQDGFCVPDPAAPVTVSETCPQGDQPEATCLLTLCPVAGRLYRDFTCCLTCAALRTTTQATTVSVSIVRTDATTEGTPTPSVVTTTPAPTPIPTIVTTSPAVTTATVSIVRTDATTEGTPTPSVVTTTPAPTPIPTIVTTSPAVTTGNTLSVASASTEPAPTLSIFSPSTEPTTPEATLSVFSPSTEPTTPEATLSVFLPSTETTPAPTLSIFSPSTENTVTLSVVVPTTPSTGIVGDSG